MNPLDRVLDAAYWVGEKTLGVLMAVMDASLVFVPDLDDDQPVPYTPTEPCALSPELQAATARQRERIRRICVDVASDMVVWTDEDEVECWKYVYRSTP